MRRNLVLSAIEHLREQFLSSDWIHQDFPVGGKTENIFQWPGHPEENIMVVVHHGSENQELFHRHNYFYFNYTYHGEYDSISMKYGSRITIREGEIYIGQPFSGHALCVNDVRVTTIIGILIQKDLFFREFLPMLSANSKFFHFLLDPATESFSDEYIHFKVEDESNIRLLLEMMVIEYAYKREDTQNVLKPLALSFLMHIARKYAFINRESVSESLGEKIVKYMGKHFATVTRKDVASHFSYHPNYLSSLLQRDLGKSYSEILLEQRMDRAVILLKGTNLSIDEVSKMLGYSNSSNFYKAFREYYDASPRKYLDTHNEN